MDLSELGEFGFIERMRAWMRGGQARIGIGDDAAVLPVGQGMALVATTDAFVVDVHFRLDWSSPADVGWKVVAASVSDLAAMGADPRWLLVSLGAPGETEEGVLAGLYRGMGEACDEDALELVGGDTFRSPQLTIAVTALGELDAEPLLRSGAKVGDVLAVTGPLGKGACGANLFLAGELTKDPTEDALACMNAHRRPRARVDYGRALRLGGAHAGLDLSDGLLSDVRRLAEASGVGVEIDAEAVPVAPEVRRIAEGRGWDALRIACAGGEDFELLTSVPSDLTEVAGVPLYPVGRVVEEGLWLVREGQREPLPEGGWDHYRT